MVAIKEGRASSRKGREGREILTVNGNTQPPQIRSRHGSAEQSPNSKNLNQTQDFENWLLNERNKWSIRRAGIFGSKRLSKYEAERALRRALAIAGDEA